MTRGLVRNALRLAAAAVVVLAVAGLQDDGPAPDPVPEAGTSARPAAPGPAAPGPAAPGSAPSGPTTGSPSGPLLLPGPHGDGDSWRDTSGREYRLGLVNAPEQDECFGAEATAARRALVADGFRADVYSRDRHGRGVSVVTTADGENLNVHLARRGFVDDRYLEDFRDENPGLAAQLDVAFAEARADGRGLWGACRTDEQAPAPVEVAAGDCHPDYVTCVPVVGDGSGRGRANDLDCADLSGPAQARRAGVDPYRLDSDGDGVGCDS